MLSKYNSEKKLTGIFIGISAIAVFLLSSCKKEPTKFDAEEAEKGVVQIFAFAENAAGSGSGFYIGNNRIITNNHVIDHLDLNALVVARKNGPDSIELQDATLQWADKELDIAILKVPEIGCQPVTLSEAPIKKSSKAYAIGFPSSANASRKAGSEEMGASEAAFYTLAFSKKRGVINNADKGLVQFLDPTVSTGEIRKVLTRKWEPDFDTELEVIDHDVNIGHGNSGGPLFDECGRVIGINTQVMHLSGADDVKNSSRITELIKVLRSRDIQANITSTPCSTTTAISLSNSQLWLIIALVVIVIGSGFYILVQKRPAIESYTQYLRRSAGQSQESHRKTSNGPIWKDGQIMENPSLKPQPTHLPATAQGYTLQGTNPEPGKPRNISLCININQLHQNGNNLTIGRKPGIAHLVIDNSSISKAHATISIKNGNFAIIDNNSANGSSINGITLNPHQRTRINPGDQLTLGEVTMTFSMQS